MEDRNVPYIVFEGTVARFERIVKRLVLALCFCILLLFVTNAVWLYTWNQYDYSDVTVDSQDGGNASYIGASGVINNAEGDSKEENQENQKEKQGN